MLKKRSAFLYLLLMGILITGCNIPWSLGGTKDTKVDFIPLEDILKQPEGKMTLYTNEEKVVLETSNLPVLNQTQNYEIWMYDKETKSSVSLGTFKVDEKGNATINTKAEKADIEDSDEILITLEDYPVEDPHSSNIVILKGEITVHADTIEIKLSVPPETSLETIFPKKITEKENVNMGSEEKNETIQKTEENAIVIIAEETELIRLSPQADDPDNDKLNYIYTSPFNENGEWQTKYSDAGQYDVTVTVSDGTDSSSMNILVIVNKKEEAPVIKSYSPEKDNIDTNEDTTIEFTVDTEDLNKDIITYIWKVDDVERGNEKVFTYKLGFDDAGEHTVTVIATDGEKSTSKSWGLRVINMNRKPILDKIDELIIKETETVRITPTATDMDNDKLSFSISEPVGDDGEWQTSYDSAGIYTVTVSVTDGSDIITQELKINVENVNRAPVIKSITKG